MTACAIIYRVLTKVTYGIGRFLAVMINASATLALLLWYADPSAPQPSALGLVAVGILFVARPAAVVVHELGHLLACRALGVPVLAFRLGDANQAVKFTAGDVRVQLGLPYKGRVEYSPAATAGPRAAITIAGSAADLVFAAVMGAVSHSLTAASRPVHMVLYTVTLSFAVVGLSNLMPFRARSGQLSDGARLLRVRADARDAGKDSPFRVAKRLAHAGRIAELLELHAGLDVPDPLTHPEAAKVALVELALVTVAQGLPPDAIALAEQRVDVLLSSCRPGPVSDIAHFAAVMLRLRQRRYTDVEPLCDKVLAREEQRRPLGILLLAAKAIARQRLGQAYREVLDAVPDWRPDVHAAAFTLQWTLEREAMLDAFRRGVPDARLGAETVAAVLRREGRVRELLELHAGFEAVDLRAAGLHLTDGPYAPALLTTIHVIADNALQVPGLPADWVDLAARRTELVLKHYPFGAEWRTLPRAAVQHTLALARLRQGRPGEVERLCQPSLDGHLDCQSRATVLATIALARQALGRPYDRPLAEAVRLDPGADLVAEVMTRATTGQPATC